MSRRLDDRGGREAVGGDDLCSGGDGDVFFCPCDLQLEVNYGHRAGDDHDVLRRLLETLAGDADGIFAEHDGVELEFAAGVGGDALDPVRRFGAQHDHRPLHGAVLGIVDDASDGAVVVGQGGDGCDGEECELQRDAGDAHGISWDLVEWAARVGRASPGDRVPSASLRTGYDPDPHAYVSRALMSAGSFRECSGDGDLRRGAGGLRGESLGGRRGDASFQDAGFDIRRERRRHRRLCVRPLRGGCGAAAVVVAAAGIANGTLIRFRG